MIIVIEGKQTPIMEALSRINNKLTTPISKTEIKGRYEKVSFIKIANFIRFIPTTNQIKNNRITARIRKK